MTKDVTSWWRRVLVGDHGELVARRAAAGEEYVVLPTRTNPRGVVDARSPVAAEELVRQSFEKRAWPQLGAPALARAARLVGPRWSASADPGHDTLREHLSTVLGSDVRLGIAVGPPRVNRKPVVRCYEGDDLVAVAKLGPETHTAALVDNEAAWLTRLGTEPIDSVVTPTLLHHGEFGPSALLVMAPLPVAGNEGVAFDLMPNHLLARFTERHRAPAGTRLESSRWFQGLPDRVAGDDDSILVAARQHYRDEDPAIELEAWHGDWSPWNLGRTADGSWCLWDWERAAVDVPRGFDCVHRHVQYGDGVEAARRELRSMGLDDDQIESTVGLYRLELATRLIEGGQWSHDATNQLRRDLAAAIGVTAGGGRP